MLDANQRKWTRPSLKAKLEGFLRGEQCASVGNDFLKPAFNDQALL